MTMNAVKIGQVCAFLALLQGCGVGVGTRMAFLDTSSNMDLPQGPPIEDLITPFDLALTCMRGKVEPSISFAVGQVVDATGKETYAEGGTGKFVTQGAGEIVQSALFKSGVTVVNRRDPNIPVAEQTWGIRDLRQQTPANFYISGSINSLDFIPGGGVGFDVAGVGTRSRQSRILIALDLSLTDAFSGRIVSNVSLQKQIFTQELGSSTDRFFGATLISLEAGGMQREAVHFALRQILNFATLELLGQLMDRQSYLSCRSMVSPMNGVAERGGIASPDNSAAIGAMARAQQQNLEAPMTQIKTTGPAGPTQPSAEQAAALAKPVPEVARQLAQRATAFAGRAIAAADAATKSTKPEEAASFASEAMQFVAVAAAALKEAAQQGLHGPEGDAAAMLVEQAMVAVQNAQQFAIRLSASAPPSAPVAAVSGGQTLPAQGATAQAAPATPPIPGTSASQRGLNTR